MVIKKWNGSSWVAEGLDIAINDIVASGTPSSSTYLRGDGQWYAMSGYTLPLAASGTRGGVRIGYTSSGLNRAVALSSEKMYVALPKATGSQYGVAKISISGGVCTIDVT